MMMRNNQSELNVFIGDHRFRAIAETDEKGSKGYLTSDWVPILWYFMGGSISDQASVIMREAVPHGHMKLGYTSINVM